MPRLFTNRPREYNFIVELVQHTKDSPRINWELSSAILYIVGGISFIIGSIFFLPKHEPYSDIGAWIFFGGSLVYLTVTGYDLLESYYHLYLQERTTFWDWLELLIATIYVGGTVLFTVGSLLFLSQIDEIVAGGWCFTIGSLLFLIGAFLNVIQIVQEPSFAKLQLLNVTAISFAIGSTLFLLASLPYLSDRLNLNTHTVLFRYVGWEYIVGSILFLIGGVAYYYRLFKVKDHQQYEESNKILLWDENSYDWALDGSQGQTMNEPEYDLKP
jgi:hypothetical protein